MLLPTPPFPLTIINLCLILSIRWLIFSLDFKNLLPEIFNLVGYLII